MWRQVGIWVILLLLQLFFIAAPAQADMVTKNRGLLITPVREYLAVDAGQTKRGSLTVINLTDKPATITLSVEQFSVTDFTYDYMFTPTKKDWIKLQTNQLQLQPNKSQQVPYAINVPKGAAPGGYYFTIFATEALADDPGRKIRVGEALYVTVNGQLRLTSYIQKTSVPWITLIGDIPFGFDVKSTGNTHFLMYISGRLEGIGQATHSEEKAHILLPDTARSVSGVVPAPVLPGIYKMTYGYRVDDGQSIYKSQYILFVPPWFFLIFAGFIWIGTALWRRKKRLRFDG